MTTSVLIQLAGLLVLHGVTLGEPYGELPAVARLSGVDGSIGTDQATDSEAVVDRLKTGNNVAANSSSVFTTDYSSQKARTSTQEGVSIAETGRPGPSNVADYEGKLIQTTNGDSLAIPRQHKITQTRAEAGINTIDSEDSATQMPTRQKRKAQAEEPIMYQAELSRSNLGIDKYVANDHSRADCVEKVAEQTHLPITDRQNADMVSNSVYVDNSMGAHVSDSKDSAQKMTGAVVHSNDRLSLAPELIPGQALVDYPVLSNVPRSSFDCANMKADGFYADTSKEARCQAFWVCHNKEQVGFLCPNGTLFNQRYLTCDWWFNVKCDDALQSYHLNGHISVLNSHHDTPPSRTYPVPPDRRDHGAMMTEILQYPRIPATFPTGGLPKSPMPGPASVRPVISAGKESSDDLSGPDASAVLVTGGMPAAPSPINSAQRDSHDSQPIDGYASTDIDLRQHFRRRRKRLARLNSSLMPNMHVKRDLSTRRLRKRIRAKKIRDANLVNANSELQPFLGSNSQAGRIPTAQNFISQAPGSRPLTMSSTVEEQDKVYFPVDSKGELPRVEEILQVKEVSDSQKLTSVKDISPSHFPQPGPVKVLTASGHQVPNGGPISSSSMAQDMKGPGNPNLLDRSKYTGLSLSDGIQLPESGGNWASSQPGYAVPPDAICPEGSTPVPKPAEANSGADYVSQRQNGNSRLTVPAETALSGYDMSGAHSQTSDPRQGSLAGLNDPGTGANGNHDGQVQMSVMGFVSDSNKQPQASDSLGAGSPSQNVITGNSYPNTAGVQSLKVAVSQYPGSSHSPGSDTQDNSPNSPSKLADQTASQPYSADSLSKQNSDASDSSSANLSPLRDDNGTPGSPPAGISLGNNGDSSKLSSGQESVQATLAMSSKAHPPGVPMNNDPKNYLQSNIGRMFDSNSIIDIDTNVPKGGGEEILEENLKTEVLLPFPPKKTGNPKLPHNTTHGGPPNLMNAQLTATDAHDSHEEPSKLSENTPTSTGNGANPNNFADAGPELGLNRGLSQGQISSAASPDLESEHSQSIAPSNKSVSPHASETVVDSESSVIKKPTSSMFTKKLDSKSSIENNDSEHPDTFLTHTQFEQHQLGDKPALPDSIGDPSALTREMPSEKMKGEPPPRRKEPPQGMLRPGKKAIQITSESISRIIKNPSRHRSMIKDPAGIDHTGLLKPPAFGIRNFDSDLITSTRKPELKPVKSHLLGTLDLNGSDQQAPSAKVARATVVPGPGWEAIAEGQVIYSSEPQDSGNFASLRAPLNRGFSSKAANEARTGNVNFQDRATGHDIPAQPSAGVPKSAPLTANIDTEFATKLEATLKMVDKILGPPPFKSKRNIRPSDRRTKSVADRRSSSAGRHSVGRKEGKSNNSEPNKSDLGINLTVLINGDSDGTVKASRRPSDDDTVVDIDRSSSKQSHGKQGNDDVDVSIISKQTASRKRPSHKSNDVSNESIGKNSGKKTKLLDVFEMTASADDKQSAAVNSSITKHNEDSQHDPDYDYDINQLPGWMRNAVRAHLSAVRNQTINSTLSNSTEVERIESIIKIIDNSGRSARRASSGQPGTSINAPDSGRAVRHANRPVKQTRIQNVHKEENDPDGKVDHMSSKTARAPNHSRVKLKAASGFRNPASSMHVSRIIL